MKNNSRYIKSELMRCVGSLFCGKDKSKFEHKIRIKRVVSVDFSRCRHVVVTLEMVFSTVYKKFIELFEKGVDKIGFLGYIISVG